MYDFNHIFLARELIMNVILGHNLLENDIDNYLNKTNKF